MSSLFQPAPEPKTRLGYYRLLSPSAAVRVSPLCLGGMNLGTKWSEAVGNITKNEAFDMMSYYYDAGGNFIDTASNYQDEESEQWIGEWMKQRDNRDQIVLATKYTSPYKKYLGSSIIQANYGGNSKKSMFLSVENSLKNLQTTYIDILYVHYWDYTTTVEELMQSLNILVQNGKVLYLGISDTPAWVVSKANQYARDHNLAQFVVYQGEWSLINRDMERDIIPMCRDEKMGIAPWGALGGGKLKTEAQIQELEETGDKGRRKEGMFGSITQKHKDMVCLLEKIGKKFGVGPIGIALAYVMHKAPYVFPIVGGRKVDHLKDNIDAFEKVHLSEQDMNEIEAFWPLDLGFPHDFLGGSHPSGSKFPRSEERRVGKECRN